MAAPPMLFDLDGTLADTLPDIANSANHVRGRSGLPPLPAAAVRGMIGEGAMVLLHRALGELQVPADDAAFWARARQLYLEHQQQHCTRQVQLYPGVRAGLERFAAAGHAMAVVTNKPFALATAIVRHFDLDALLPVVIGGDTLAVHKPDPAPLRLALARLDAGTTAGVMVGDGVPDLRAGRAAGLSTIACLYGYGDAAALRGIGADRYWSRFGGEG